MYHVANQPMIQPTKPLQGVHELAAGPDRLFPAVIVWIAAVVAVVCCAFIAWQSRPAAHADEFFHVDSFRFFESHWFPPAPNSDEVIYSSMGWSRVYTGEIAYLVMAKVDVVLRSLHLAPKGIYRQYRLLNVLLFALTLGAFLYVRVRSQDMLTLAILFIAIPQVIYIYSYANSDAWGVSASAFAWIAALRLWGHYPRKIRWRDSSMYAVSIGAVVLSKAAFMLALVIPILIGVFIIIRLRRLRKGVAFWRDIVVLLAPLALVFCGAGIWTPRLIPWRTLQYHQALSQMQIQESDPSHVPGHAEASGMNLNTKGYNYSKLITEKNWISKCWRSGYATFEYWKYQPPVFICATATFLIALIAALNGWASICHIRTYRYIVALMLLGLLILITNVAGSLINSLYYDFQPQGRYLFGALVPMSVWWTSVVWRPRWMKVAVRSSFAMLLVLSIYTLVSAEIVHLL